MNENRIKCSNWIPNEKLTCFFFCIYFLFSLFLFFPSPIEWRRVWFSGPDSWRYCAKTWRTCWRQQLNRCSLFSWIIHRYTIFRWTVLSFQKEHCRKQTNEFKTSLYGNDQPVTSIRYEAIGSLTTKSSWREEKDTTTITTARTCSRIIWSNHHPNLKHQSDPRSTWDLKPWDAEEKIQFARNHRLMLMMKYIFFVNLINSCEY